MTVVYVEEVGHVVTLPSGLPGLPQYHDLDENWNARRVLVLFCPSWLTVRLDVARSKEAGMQ